MNSYAILPLICLCLLFGLGIFVLLHKPKTGQKILLSLLYFQAFYWQLVWFVSFFSVDPWYTDYLAKLSYATITFLPFTFYHFIISYLKLTERRWVLASYALAILLVLLLPTDLFVTGHQEFGWGNFAAPGHLYPVYMLSALVIMTRGLFLLMRAYRKPAVVGVTRNQLRYIFLGLFLYYTCAIDFLSVYGARWYPLGELSFLGSFLVITYAILLHRLMDIEVIVKRTLVFAGLASFALGVFWFITSLARDFLSPYLAIPRLPLNILSVLIVIAGYEPLRTWLGNITDKYLFQKKFDFAQVLKDASRDLAWVTNLEDLTRKMLYVLIHKARVKHAAIYVRPTETDRFQLQGCEGDHTKEPLKFFLKEHPLISYLGEYKAPVTRALIGHSLEQMRNNSKHSQFSEIRSLMIESEAEVIVPSFLSGSTEKGIENHPFLHLQGFVILGGKKSDEDYTQQDLDILAAIAQEHAVSFEKIRIFDEYLKERELKLKAEKTAEQVNYTRTLKHETGNKLVGIENAAINLRKEFSGWFVGLRNQIEARFSDTELKMYNQLQDVVKRYADNIEGTGAKVRMTIDSVVGGLSGDQASKQMMDFRVPWETAKRNVKVDYDFRFDVKTEDPFKIYGNVNSVEQVFENFFTNSRDAMENLKEKLISLRGSYRDHQGKKVSWLEYWDAGSGVPEELFEKVFEQGFSTKPKPKTPTSMESGHGHGLYVCRKIVEDHGGKIWLEKRPESGSKFVFWLPLQDGSAK